MYGPMQTGKNIWRIRNNTNSKLDHVISGVHIVRFIRAQRIKWLGRVQKIDTSRISKKNIRKETNGKMTIGKTETEMVG
jgi:hypothetical protein